MKPENQFTRMSEWNNLRLDDVEAFEKINRNERIKMPVAAHRSAKNGSFKTARSRKAGKKVSRISGGTHQRRLHQWH